MNNESILVSAFLNYVLHCDKNGESEKIYELGLCDEDIVSITKLSSSEMEKICDNYSCVGIDFDSHRFGKTEKHVESQRMALTTMENLVAEDAPFELMEMYYGFTSNIYCDHRRRLGLSERSGRPTDTTPEEEQVLWKIFTARPELDPKRLSAQDYMDLFQLSHVQLRTIWRLIQEWNEKDIFSADSGKH